MTASLSCQSLLAISSNTISSRSCSPVTVDGRRAKQVDVDDADSRATRQGRQGFAPCESWTLKIRGLIADNVGQLCSGSKNGPQRGQMSYHPAEVELCNAGVQALEPRCLAQLDFSGAQWPRQFPVSQGAGRLPCRPCRTCTLLVYWIGLGLALAISVPVCRGLVLV